MIKSLIKNAETAIMYLKFKKKIKNDDDSCDMCLKLLQKEDKLNPSIYIQNIEFLQTCIIHMLIKYLDMNQSEVKMEVFQMKKLTFI